MIDANPVSIPMDPGQDLSLETGEDVHNVPYREAIGSLIYLVTVTRPDICYAVNRLSQYMERPKQKHWNGVKKVLKYLKSSVNYGTLYKSNSEDSPHRYSDADFAGDVDSRKSTTGYVFMNAGGAITWASRKQQVVALSTMEAEYIAGSAVAQEAATTV